MSLLELLASVIEVDGLDEASGPGRPEAWSSLKQLQVVVALEEMYGVTLSVPEIESLVSVARIREVLATKGAAVA